MTTRQIQPPQFQRQTFTSDSSSVFDGSRHGTQLLEFFYVGTATADFKIFTKIPEERDHSGSQWIEHPLSGVSGSYQLKLDGPWSVKVECLNYMSGTIYVKLYGYSEESLAINGARRST